MKAKVFSFVKVADDSMVASVRIARFVSETLEIPLCWDESISAEQLDYLIIINGAYAFAGPVLDHLGAAIEAAGRVVWIQNDYTIIPPKHVGYAETPFRKAFRTRYEQNKPTTDYWTTIKSMSSPGVTASRHLAGEHSRYINWNALTFDLDSATIPFGERVMKDWMVYYGSFRKGRSVYFDRYFKEPKILTAISCPNRKFSELYPSELILHDAKAQFLSQYLRNFGLGLYIEDRASHKDFHSPANRFYEMLSAGVPIVFQSESVGKLLEAGYAVQNWVADSPRQVAEAMERKEDILDEQTELLKAQAEVERLTLKIHLNSAWQSIQ